MTTLLWLLSTIGGAGALGAAAYLSLFFAPQLTRYLAIAALAWGAFGGYTVYERHEATKAALEQVEREKKDAIEIGKKARERVRDLCNAGAAGCVPDDWFRD